MQGDIKDVPALAFEPGGHPAELIVMFEQQDRASCRARIFALVSPARPLPITITS